MLHALDVPAAAAAVLGALVVITGPAACGDGCERCGTSVHVCHASRSALLDAALCVRAPWAHARRHAVQRDEHLHDHAPGHLDLWRPRDGLPGRAVPRAGSVRGLPARGHPGVPAFITGLRLVWAARAAAGECSSR